MSIQKEQFLAEALQNGDKFAYEQLYCNLFDGAMCYLSITFELSQNDAYDIVSSVFAKLPSIIDKYDSTQDFIKWFHTVVNNSARDYMKKESRSIPIEPERLMQYIADAESNNEKGFEQIERATRLHQIIAELSDKQCIATTLHYLHGFTVAETAERMKIKPATVKEYLSRAKKAITKKIKMEGDHTHWLGGLIPKISAEITNKFEYFTNAGIEAKTVVATMTAVAVVGGAVVPAHISQPPQYVAPQEEIAATVSAPPQQIDTTPQKQEHQEIGQALISKTQPKAQAETELPIREINTGRLIEPDKGGNTPQAEDIENRFTSGENRSGPHQELLENLTEVITPDDTAAQTNHKTLTKTYYITDSRNVTHTIEEVYDENGNLIQVNRNGEAVITVIGAMPSPWKQSGVDKNEPTVTSDEETGEPDTADTLDADDSGDDGTELIKFDKSLLGGPDCKLTDLNIVFDEYGNRYISIKKDSNSNQIQEKMKDVNALEDAETIEENDIEKPVLLYDDSDKSDCEPEESTLECEGTEGTAEFSQDAESLSPPEEAPD